MPITTSSFSDFIFAALQKAHSERLSVGGLFNAYEPVLHYNIYCSALDEGSWDTTQEQPYGEGQKTCDLKIPLSDNASIWLEIKMWWFLFDAYESPYVMQSKTKYWPVDDWKRLQKIPKNDHRALLLMSVWDNDRGRNMASDWLSSLTDELRKNNVPALVNRQLDPAAYQGKYKHTRAGKLILWFE